MQTCVEYYEHCWILLEDIQVFASLVRDQFHLWWQPVTSVHLSNPWLATTQPNSLCWCVMLVALSLEKCGWWQNLTQVAIFLAHLPNKTFFGYNFSTHKWGVATRVAHDWIGYLILVMTISQSAMGLSKLAGLRDGRALVMNNLSYSTSLGVKRYGKNTGVFSDIFFFEILVYFHDPLWGAIFKFHGTLGKVIMVLSAVNVVLACVFWGWSTGYKIFVALLTVAVTAFAAFTPAKQSDETQPIVAETKA